MKGLCRSMLHVVAWVCLVLPPILAAVGFLAWIALVACTEPGYLLAVSVTLGMAAMFAVGVVLDGWLHKTRNE